MAHFFNESGDGALVARRKGFDPAVPAVAHPASQAQGRGFPLRPIAIADALDASGDQEMDAAHFQTARGPPLAN
jgi:hypothetical protein